ncbi:MAG TPA: BLUF domain-containing protein [Burkholderiales bacterium]|jgi:hypothetical protein|nr:BLUF domain-containing protein [Burkholderiales bacterium]
MENLLATPSRAVARAGTGFAFAGAAPRAAFEGLVYTAEAGAAFDAARLREFSAAAARRNALLGLTGHAYVHGGRVVEYIEGPAEALEQAHAAIQADPQLTVRQSARAPVAAGRRFEAWHLEACGADLMELRLEHVLETVLQNLAADLFGAGENLSAIWRLVDAIARRQASSRKPVGSGSTRLVFTH